MRLPRALWIIPILIALGILTVIVTLIRDEMHTSKLQAEWLSAYGKQMTYMLQPGPNPELHYPPSGPYNQRLGYSYLPFFIKSLQTDDYAVQAQMRTSKTWQYFEDRGLYPIYHAKTVAGLTLYDREGQRIYASAYPDRVFTDFHIIPPLLTDTLLYIEIASCLRTALSPATRSLNGIVFSTPFLDRWRANLCPASTQAAAVHSQHRLKNFAIHPAAKQITRSIKCAKSLPHPCAFISTAKIPVRQGKKIVLDYLNSTPLSARPGFGEINGIGTGYGPGSGSISAML